MHKHSDSKNSLKPAIIIVFFLLVTFSVILFIIANSKTDEQDKNIDGSISNVVKEMDGKQIIDLTAKNGFYPAVINAKSNKETILKVETKNTFDCSTSIRIPAINYSNNLPSNGITEIIISSDKAKGELVGTCSMGMYSFKINFI